MFACFETFPTPPDLVLPLPMVTKARARANGEANFPPLCLNGVLLLMKGNVKERMDVPCTDCTYK